MDLDIKTSMFEGLDVGNTLSKATNEIQNTISGLTDQMINPFKSAGNAISDGVALVDENTTQLTSTLSSFKSSTLDKIGSTLKNITGGLLDSPDLGRILDLSDGFKVNTDELLRIASNGLGFNISSISGIKDQLGDAFLGELNSMTGGLMNGLVYQDGSKFSINDSWKYDTGKTLLDFLGRQDNKFGHIINLAGVNSILNTMLDQTMQNGIYDSYESFRPNYVYESDYKDALINGLQFCLGNGDLESLNKILEIISTEGANKVKAKYPTFTEQLLSSFTFTNSTNPEQYPELKTKLLNVLTLVNGSDWYTTYNGVTKSNLPNVAIVSYITNDAKLLLEGETALIPLLACTGLFYPGDAKETFKTDFPNAIPYE